MSRWPISLNVMEDRYAYPTGGPNQNQAATLERRTNPYIQVRLATYTDGEAIVAFDKIAQSQRFRANYIHRAIANRECYVGTYDRMTLGYGILEYNFFGHGFISLLCVHPEYYRQGIATAMIDGIEQACKTVKLFSSTPQSNVPMQSLLERNGFVSSGYVQHLDEQDPELIFFKRLK